MVLLATWLLLNDTVAPGHIVLGCVLALAIPAFARRFWLGRLRMRRPVLLRNGFSDWGGQAHFAFLDGQDFGLVSGHEALTRERRPHLGLDLRRQGHAAAGTGTVSTRVPGR